MLKYDQVWIVCGVIMKRFILFLFVFGTVSQAQYNWFWQNPLPQGNHLNDVKFISSTTGWAVGEYGTILKTTNGGTTWIIQQSGTVYNLHGVSFTDANHGTVVGSGGTILRTTNGGSTWNIQSAGITKPLKDVCFTSTNIGTIVGTDIILRTTNGGQTWLTQYDDNEGHFEAVSFFDNNYGMAVGYNADLGDAGIIYKTTNGGTTWTSAGGGSLLFDVEMISQNTAIVAGENNLVLRTTDGGLTWDLQHPGENYHTFFWAISFADASNGVIIGGIFPFSNNENILLRTTNGGVSWDLQTINSGGYLLLEVSFSDVNRGTIVGEAGVILHTENRGSTWTTQSRGSTDFLYDVSFINNNSGMVVGNGGIILRTTNQGATWSQHSSGTENSLFAVRLLNLNIAFAAGAHGTILKTTNAGVSWTAQSSGVGEWINDIFFFNMETGIVAGTTGLILRTTNGGTSWSKQTSGTFWDLHSVSFADDVNGIAVGKNGTIIKSTNGGISWSAQSSGTTEYLNGVAYLSSDNAVVVGDNGIILKTTNGGTTWTFVPVAGGWVSLKDVSFSDDYNGTAAGSIMEAGWEYGLILRTTNGGNSWIKQPGGTANGLNAVDFSDFYNGTVVGEYGTILRTTNSGGIPVELVSFNAVVNGKDVVLTWVTATETNNSGFEVERKSDNDEFRNIGFVPGNGTTTEQQYYQYTDEDLTEGSFTYRLKQIDYDGTFEYSDEISIQLNNLPLVYSIQQNYPNPFNPLTLINYSVPEEGFVTIILFDALGREVKTLLSEESKPGNYTIEFNSEILASGIYYYRMNSGSFIQTRKMILMR
jgi:photosystem II stability/assembly factor-like uncharacterized protein